MARGELRRTPDTPHQPAPLARSALPLHHPMHLTPAATLAQPKRRTGSPSPVPTPAGTPVIGQPLRPQVPRPQVPGAVSRGSRAAQGQASGPAWPRPPSPHHGADPPGSGRGRGGAGSSGQRVVAAQQGRGRCATVAGRHRPSDPGMGPPPASVDRSRGGVALGADPQGTAGKQGGAPGMDRSSCPTGTRGLALDSNHAQGARR